MQVKLHSELNSENLGFVVVDCEWFVVCLLACSPGREQGEKEEEERDREEGGEGKGESERTSRGQRINEKKKKKRKPKKKFGPAGLWCHIFSAHLWLAAQFSICWKLKADYLPEIQTFQGSFESLLVVVTTWAVSAPDKHIIRLSGTEVPLSPHPIIWNDEQWNISLQRWRGKLINRQIVDHPFRQHMLPKS